MQAQVACRIATTLFFGGGFKFGDFYLFFLNCNILCTRLQVCSHSEQ